MSEIEHLLQGVSDVDSWKKIRSSIGIKLEQSRDYDIEPIKTAVFAADDNIFFCYFSNAISKITKKQVRFLLDKKHDLGNDLTNAKYLVLMIHKDDEPIIVGVDLVNRNNPKITTFHIDTKGTFNLDENKTVYKNRTLIEQFADLQKDLAGGGRELKVRYMKHFFEKQKLTENFYAIYKTELFEKIKKHLTGQFGKADQDIINNFVLANLNRLLFIHFLDKKGKIFPEYDIAKRGSYISYLFHKVYKEMNTTESFYEAVLQPLFFEVFNKPQFDRQIAHDPILFKEFYNLPYLNGGLFKKASFEKGTKYFIDNVFIKAFIIKIIDQFNFTITEDTPFEVKVSVDPELLGYIFENLIQDYDNSKDKAEDERSKGGIFYTPKIEVDFMCRQVLVEYLSKKDKLKDLKPQLYELFYTEKGSAEDQKYGSFTGHQIGHIFNYLEEIKVVDPACGSGAFLVGMMQVILDIENTLFTQNISKLEISNDPLVKAIKEKTPFQRKKQLIKQALHGVDIKSRAVEIAKLRLWLSMIVDIDESVFQKENARTEPLLPSFGFKIVQGDSLVNRIGDKLIPIDIGRKDILDKKMRDKVGELANFKNEYYDNKHKDEYIVKKKEQEIYETILSNKITYLKAQITILEQSKNSSSKDSSLFGKPEFGKEYDTEKLDTKKIDKGIEEYKTQIETLIQQLHDITVHGQLPFARGIDFSEVFTEQGGFDVVVGNPPYVRQEAIEDPTGVIKDKKDYKNLLVNVVNQDWFDDIRKYRKDDLKIGGRSDLYLYFYFRGLKLLNGQGVFTFITSNSRLDVDFGSILQEFLIKYCPSIKVFDNQVQRSFVSASVNTIMCFFDKPIIEAKNIITGTAQFVNFHKPYEESIWTETMAELDHQTLKKLFSEKIIKTGNVQFIKRNADELRVIDVDSENLWLDGSEVVGEKGLDARKYNGNKWGGKFLRAPEVFYKILETNKVRILGEFYEISPGCYTGINDFFYVDKKTIKEYEIEEEYLIPVIRNAREVETLKIDNALGYSVLGIDSVPKSELKPGILNYIERGEKQVTRERQKTSAGIPRNKVSSVANRKFWYSIPKQNLMGTSLFMQYVGSDRFYCPFSEERITSDRSFHRLFAKEGIDNTLMTAVLNSTLQSFFVMLFGRGNLGQGALKFETTDAKKIFVLDLNNISNEKKEKIYAIVNRLGERKAHSLFKEIGIDQTKSIYEQTPNPLTDRKELDDIIFDEIGLIPEERNEVYWSLAELVKARLDKAKSV